MNAKRSTKQQPAPKSKPVTGPRPKRVRKKAARRDQAGLSPCALEYARSLANPFTGPEACVPNYPVLLTRKTRVYSKGTFSTGTTGLGYICVDPREAVANDNTCVISTDATFTGALIQTTAGTGVNFSGSNSEYTRVQFGATPSLNQYRVVSAGLRIRYIGTELNKGGQELGFADPEHNNPNGNSYQTLDANLESKRLPVSREKWSTILYRPFFADDLDMVDSFPATSVADGFYYMVFAVQAASAGTSLAYEYEFYVNHEISGRNVRSKTPSHFDPTGFSAVHAATVVGESLYPTQKTSAQSESTFVQAAHRYLNDAVSLGRTIWDVGKAAAPIVSMLL